MRVLRQFVSEEELRRATFDIVGGIIRRAEVNGLELTSVFWPGPRVPRPTILTGLILEFREPEREDGWFPELEEYITHMGVAVEDIRAGDVTVTRMSTRTGRTTVHRHRS